MNQCQAFAQNTTHCASGVSLKLATLLSQSLLVFLIEDGFEGKSADSKGVCKVTQHAGREFMTKEQGGGGGSFLNVLIVEFINI